MTPAIIEVTPSCSGPNPFPVEVGVALADGRCHCYLIRPEPGWLADSPRPTPIHGLSDELLLQCGTPIQEVAVQLNRLLRGQGVYSQDWGLATTLISRLYYDARAVQLFLIDSLHQILTPALADEWERMQARVRDELALTRHRASSEALSIQKTLSRSA